MSITASKHDCRVYSIFLLGPSAQCEMSKCNIEKMGWDEQMQNGGVLAGLLGVGMCPDRQLQNSIGDDIRHILVTLSDDSPLAAKRLVDHFNVTQRTCQISQCKSSEGDISRVSVVSFVFLRT